MFLHKYHHQERAVPADPSSPMPVTVRESGPFLGASPVADSGILGLLTRCPIPVTGVGSGIVSR
jgi:hypothetical protein